MNASNSPPRPAVSFRVQLACAAGIALTALGVRADDAASIASKSATREVAVCSTPRACIKQPASAADRVEHAWVEAPAASLSRPRIAQSGAHDLPEFEFHDNGDLVRRVADTRTLPVMALWRTRHTQFYLGVDQKGIAGLHFRQRGPRDLSAIWRASDALRRGASSAAAESIPRSVSP